MIDWFSPLVQLYRNPIEGQHLSGFPAHLENGNEDTERQSNGRSDHPEGRPVRKARPINILGLETLEN
jgi:hypothetical protein